MTAFYGDLRPRDAPADLRLRRPQPAAAEALRGRHARLLDARAGLPLGIFPTGKTTSRRRIELVPGDQIVFYTDGMTEAEGPGGEQFGLARLDSVLANCSVGAGDLLRRFCASWRRSPRPARAGRPHGAGGEGVVIRHLSLVICHWSLVGLGLRKKATCRRAAH